MPTPRAENEPPESDGDAPATRPKATGGNPRNLFVSFRNRMACTVIEMFAIMFVVAQLRDAMQSAGWPFADSRPMLACIVVLYFAVAWTCPIGATPIQFLWGIRVVDYAGRPLRFWRALLRSASVVAITAGAFTVFRVLQEPYMAIVAIGAIGLFFVAAVTPHRQAAHDFLVRSLVVYRRALKQPESAALLHLVGAQDASKPRTIVRLRFADLALDIATLAIPLAMLAVALPIHRHKNMAARVQYAINETREMKQSVQQFYLEHGKFPTNATEIGFAARTDYPDGGYYQLEVNGEVRIRFTVKPELKSGSLLLTPTISNGKFFWGCSVEGSLDISFVPRSCRG